MCSAFRTIVDNLIRTWRGERGEEWSSAQGLESILISIQSLMSSNPYENEPGFENAKQEKDKDNMKLYVRKVLHPSCLWFSHEILIQVYRFDMRLYESASYNDWRIISGFTQTEHPK